MKSLVCSSVERLSEVLFEFVGNEIDWENIPNATTGIRCLMPTGEIVNYFPTTHVVTLQGKGDPAGLRSRIEDALYDDCKLEPPVPAILPPPSMRGVPNSIVLAFGALGEDAEQLSTEMESFALRPILWDVCAETRNTPSEMAQYIRSATQFGFVLSTPQEWRNQNIQRHLGLIIGMTGMQNAAVLFRKEKRNRITNIPKSIHTLSFKDSVEEIMNDVMSLVYTNADRSVQKMMFRANRGRNSWNIPKVA